ncbi:MAG: energy transducer TonB [Rhodospirillales bacterium]
MNRPLILSAVLHTGLAVLLAYNAPLPEPDPFAEQAMVIVEMVEITDETTAPPIPDPQPKPEQPKEEAKPEPKPAPPPPEPPKQQQAALPPPAPKVEAEPEPEPEPAPEPEPEAEQTPEPEPDPAPQVAKVLEQIDPPKKPKPPAELTSVLKDLLANMETPEPPAQQEAKKTFNADIAKLLKKQPNQPRPLADPSAKVTISEIDAVRRQIQRCWNVPAGARGAENLVIAIKTRMNRDGTVEAANIVDSTRTRSDNFYRTAAESALRAVLNDKCQPFRLSPEKYADWREITFTFDPREMF